MFISAGLALGNWRGDDQSGSPIQKLSPIPPSEFGKDFFPYDNTLQYFNVNSTIICWRHLESSLDHLSNFSPKIIAKGTDQV